MLGPHRRWVESASMRYLRASGSPLTSDCCFVAGSYTKIKVRTGFPDSTLSKLESGSWSWRGSGDRLLYLCAGNDYTLYVNDHQSLKRSGHASVLDDVGDHPQAVPSRPFWCSSILDDAIPIDVYGLSSSDAVLIISGWLYTRRRRLYGLAQGEREDGYVAWVTDLACLVSLEASHRCYYG